MTTAVQRLTTLAQAMGTDVKQIILTLGLLANLATTDKSSFVAAINEVKGDVVAINTKIGDMSFLGTSASFTAPQTIDVAGTTLTLVITETINGYSYYGYRNEPAEWWGIVVFNPSLPNPIGDVFQSYDGNNFTLHWTNKSDVNGVPTLNSLSMSNTWSRDGVSFVTGSAYATLVDAIAAALDAGNMAANLIDDAATNGITDKTWSADKIYDELLVTKNAVIQELTGTAPELLNTFQEVAAKLGEDDNLIQQVIGGLANRVRFDEPQQLTQAQQLQVRQNTGAAAQSQVDALQTTVDGLGDLSGTDLLAVYNAAKT